jgi:hypothetical protein
MILEAVATKLIVYDNDEVNIVEGTYFDFIERIGWQDEGGVRVKKPKGKRNDADKRRNRKDAKKLRSAVTAD